MKWAVCSFSDRKEFTDISYPIMSEYCKTHGYTFIPYTHIIDPSRHPMWNKIPILNEVLNQGYDIVVWIDDDIIITEKTVSLDVLFADFIQSQKSLALSAETTHGRKMNTGIICAKQGSQTVVSRIWNDGVTDENRLTPGCEQWAMHILYEKDEEFREKLMLYPPATLQGFYNIDIPDAHWRHGTWSIHPAGLSNEEKISIMRQYAFTDEYILNTCSAISVTSKERQQHTIDHVTRIVKEKIKGDFIEIGVYKGGMVMVMLYTLLRLGEFRHVHLYDTFSGMSEASENDVDMFGRKATDMWEAVKMECPLDIVKKNIELTGYPVEYIHYHVGDARQITETPECISLLRLDIDWYDIYKAVLPVFEPVTSIGGTVVIDDYIHWKGCKKAVDEYIVGKNIQVQMIDYDSCFWIKNYNNVIPQIVFQTAREPLSSDVTRLIKSKIPNGWEYTFFDDDDIIEFLKNNPDEEFPDVISLFNRIKRGQNKTDFFRAYFLYKKGGIFIDSDAMVECSFSDLTKYEFFTTESGAISGSVFNGFLGCTPGHPIIHEHVKYLYNADENAYETYFIACYNLYTIINSKSWGNIKIFNERNIYHTYVWQSYDPVNNQIIAYHYPFTKLVPTDYLRVYQWNNKIRLGSFMDGGYVIADNVGQYDCYISCGIGTEEAFSTEFVQKYTIKESYAFDGSLTQPWRDPTPGIQFVPKNIGTVNNDKMTDLVDILSKHSDVFLKMDIEGHEFAWIKHVPIDLMNNIKQITMEFHGIHDDSWDVPYKVKRECFEKLSRTHYIVHAHGNNWASLTNRIPDVIELTFVRRDVFSTQPAWNTTKLPLKYIDRPNNPGAEDYFLSFPPFFYEPDKQVKSEPRFETRKEMIEKLVPKFGVYAEVGVFKGEFTTFLQDVLCPKKLYAIDLFEGVTGSGDQDGQNFSHCQLEETRSMLEGRNIITIKGDSSEMLRTLDDNSLDMVYIDANHSFDYVLRDLESSFSKVKHGGWIMGHDYEMNMKKAGWLNACEPLQRAVNMFCKKYAQNIKYKAYDGCVSFAIHVSKIAICSLSDRKPVSDVSWTIMKAYCDNHGYVFKTQRYSDPSRGSSWSKIPLLKNVLNEGFQIAVWLDDDIIITERDVRIEKLVEEFIDSDKLLCVSGDNWASAYFNAGIIIAKQGAQCVLQSIWDDGVCEENKFTPCMEQWGMHTLYGHNESFRKKVFVYQPHYLQSFYKNPYSDMPPAYNWKPGVWSAHVSGIINQDERVGYMKEISENLRDFDYKHMEDEERPCAARFAEWVVKTLDPKNVLDVGCGPGMYVDEILKYNVTAIGIEVSDQIQKPYVRNKSLFDMTETADVVMCLEVAEHIPENKADDIVQKIVSATERILIWSAAIPGQSGVGHINCQPKEYWREKFVQQGLEYDDECTQNCRQYISEHPPYMGWFLNNVQIFRKPTVTLTITTCKRIGSFYKTMNSLKKHCKDLCTVFVVDDSSSVSDRIEMQKIHPIILTTHDTKSHAHSLNIIRENIKTDYILMFEDDWVCQEDFYIWDVIKYMKQHNIDNLRFNTNLMEDGVTLFNPDKLSQENALWCQQKGYILEKSETDSGVGWPGFSLNPIMIRRDVLDEPFDESISSGYMEFDWAIRHANKKWYGKNTGGIHHIDGNESAYVLNETHRWWDPK